MHPLQKPKKRLGSGIRLVGAQVANFRRAEGLTQRELAERLRVSEQLVASIEQGRRPLKRDLAELMDQLLDTKGALEVLVDNLPEIDSYPVWAMEFIDLEREAIALSWYENQVLPGLLQTEAYARATFRSRVPVLGEDEVEQQVTARIARQGILHRKVPRTISFVISEAILMDRLGGREVYEEQLHHLCDCADLPGVSLQVMPFGRETHAALDGPFVLLESPDHLLVSYTETQRGSQLTSDGDEVSILGQKYAMLRSQALNPEETKGLLERRLGER
jgi:transcriptional regulator with XRE-family HTH domain